MAEMKPGDHECARACVKSAVSKTMLSQVSEGLIVPWWPAVDIIATYREQCEQAARDETARKAFKIGCLDCDHHVPVELEGHSWWHKQGNDHRRCRMSHIRLALDPDGRLAGPAEVKP